MADDKPAARPRKEPKGAADLAQRMGGMLAPPAAAPPAKTRAPRAGSGRGTARRTTDTGKGTKAMTTPAPMAAEQAKPTAFYSARVSHATTPEQLAELEQIRLAENTARRAARRPAISITALLRAATQICLDNDRLRAQMIKRAGEEWN